MSDTAEQTPPPPPQDPDLARLDALAKLLDNQFRIPATNLRFGLDGLIGLVPYLGDMTGFVVSGFLMHTMLRKGAGPLLMLRMLFNFVLDAIVGIVPVVGDLFDFGFKAAGFGGCGHGGSQVAEGMVAAHWGLSLRFQGIAR